MKESLTFGSFALLLSLWLCLNSCSSSLHSTASELPPILSANTTSQRYNMQLNFMKHHFSGMLIVRQLPHQEIRILATTYFGLSLFDLSLQKDTFVVNSCIEPMKKEKILKLLEMDFKQLFLSSSTTRIKEKSNSWEQRIGGKGFGKSLFSLSEYIDGEPQRVQINHPWIRLSIQLDRLPVENAPNLHADVACPKVFSIFATYK